ncbi:homocysteine S-methyltransferase family protein [Aliiroseovarius marinus]|uniref:homocysteine S-methyltransferase family protein n=1 Tax=Aliiroseovarius marinus TaxID=2500159 RepID=UPI00105F39B0|nr:homocysteine S-methyltransferase family protein [Aliiroseovarius marinus]
MTRKLPHDSDRKFLAYTGTGTDLIFNHGLDLPGFASFPLLENSETRSILAGQMHTLIQLASEMDVGCILDTPTWMANADRAAPLGYGDERLAGVNRDAASLMDDVRRSAGREDILVSACIGPCADPYAKMSVMSVDEARAYHTAQLSVLRETAVDMATAYTFNRRSEAAGCILAARDVGLPIVMSLVVETDGCLADGTPLTDAIDQIDADSGSSAAYFMVNCAHPSHFAGSLNAHPRLRGVVANASRCSHAELDEAEKLDEGDPRQLGREIADIVKSNPAITVFGGCCGTDMRHLKEMVRALSGDLE